MSQKLNQNNEDRIALLQSRLKKANNRWDLAMVRKGYRDDPNEPPAFSEKDWRLYFWADTWRLCVHKIENELESIPDLRRVIAENSVFVSSSEQTFYVSEMSVSALASSTANLRLTRQENKPRQR